jgi:hypothetical protein
VLGELTASSRRLALVGLAKNTGKTEALAALLRELEAEGRRVGVTSIGRDGEEHDVIDSRIDKPRVRVAAGSLVATTDTLLRASGIPHELLEKPGVRTPLGRVLIARLQGAGAIVLAGPSAAADVRAASDAMLSHGAEQVLIDGAADRRAASSPAVADGLVLATGAVLGRDVGEVVRQTSDAVALVRMAALEESSQAGRRLRALAASHADGDSVLVAEDLEPVGLPPRFVLSGEPEQIAEMLDANPRARWLIVGGALPDRFMRVVAQALHRRRRKLVLVVADPTKVFLSKGRPESYERQGVQLRALRGIELEALTINPVAPRSHRFDSAQLRTMLGQAIPDVPIFDVLDPGYMAARSPAGARPG